MARLTLFHYIQKKTPLHEMDGRLKLLSLFLVMFSIGRLGQWQGYALLAGISVLALLVSKLPMITLLKEMKLLIIFLLVIFWVAGWERAGQFTLIVIFGTIMAGTTPVNTVKNAIEWYLRPIPFIPEARVAMVINLTFVLIPLIFDQYVSGRDAGRARGIELNNNPIRRIKFLIYPLLERTFRSVDELIDAMESRCYSEVRTKVLFKTRKTDWLILLICVVLFMLISTRW